MNLNPPFLTTRLMEHGSPRAEGSVPRMIQVTTLLALPAAVALVACGRQVEATGQPSDVAEQQDLIAIPSVSDLAVGSNRFAFVLLRPDGTELADASAAVDFYLLINDEEAVLKETARASFQRMAVELPHVHEDGEVHPHDDVRSLYVVPQATLDAVGKWVAAVSASPPGEDGPKMVTLAFQVRERGFTPAIGDPSLSSSTPTATSPEGLDAICSRQPPGEMHSVSVHESLAAGRPFVVVFASPSFCQTRICGPVTELVHSLREDYDARMDFIHVEPYDLELLRSEGRFELTPTAKEWGLPTEPWVFVVDAAGRVRAKFEGPFGASELEEAIETALAPPD